MQNHLRRCVLIGCASALALAAAPTWSAIAQERAPSRAQNPPPAELWAPTLGPHGAGPILISGSQPPTQPNDMPPAVSPSIVPPHFGEAEELPPPGGVTGMLLEESAFDAYGHDGWPMLHVHHWFDSPWFSHSDPNDPYRHVGHGQPLIGTSWRNRPWFVGTFVGGILMEDLIDSRINQNDTAFMGFRLGFDFDHYWGLEWRWAYAAPELTGPDGLPLDSHSNNYYADVSLVHYPWGDARWRPYLSAGLGFQTFRFYDEFDNRVSESPLGIPLAIGVKYFHGPWFTLRFEVVDNIAVGNDEVSAMSNFALVTGCEYRFGGRRLSYFPWHNNTSYW